MVSFLDNSIFPVNTHNYLFVAIVPDLISPSSLFYLVPFSPARFAIDNSTNWMVILSLVL